MQMNSYVANLKQSGIRSASTRCNAIGGINLGQGICQIPVEEKIKQAACHAIFADNNIYAPHEGVHAVRQLLLEKVQQFNHINLPSEDHLMISHGATGAYVAAAKTLFASGDEVILFEPFYGYHKSILGLFDIVVKTVPIDLKTGIIDFDRLTKTITPKTKAIVICSPCNPNGKIFSKEELLQIGSLARTHDLWIITDEIYEYITYGNHQHISIASLEDFFSRTITISGFSKTYNVTGWRLGYAYGPAAIIEKMALVHDLFYVCPPTPLQHAMVTALQLPKTFYQHLTSEFDSKRRFMVPALESLGFEVTHPQGAYYLMVNIKSRGFDNDEQATTALLEKAKVATVPGRAFYLNPQDGQNYIRICYAMADEKLHQAIENLKALS